MEGYITSEPCVESGFFETNARVSEKQAAYLISNERLAFM